MTFGLCTKNGVIRKTRLLSKFMTLVPGSQTIAIHILPNISRTRRKSNQTIKFGLLIECNKIFFFKNHAENKAERLVPDLFLFFTKALYEVKANGK